MDHQPLILLALNTAAWYGRGAALGVTKYARNFTGWRLRFAVQGKPQQAEIDRGVCGAIGQLNSAADSALFLSRGFPCVNIGASFEGIPSSATVWPDHAHAGYLAAEHLLANGLTKICYVYWPVLHSRLRGEGVRQALAERGLTVAAEWAFDDSVAARIVALHRQSPERQPIGVIFNPDRQASELIEGILAGGLRVPDDVSVVGIDNDYLESQVGPVPVSSVDVDWVNVGYQAASVLDGLLAGKAGPGTPLMVPPKGVVVRQSSDFLAVPDAEVVTALRFIRTNATKGIDVDDICAAVAISRRSLERKFAKHLHRLPHVEVLRCRLIRARQLLIDSDLPIPRVAALCSFASGEVLAITFKKHMGMTPTAYRAAHRR